LRRGPTPDHRRALELLASSPDGCTEALLLANGFAVELLVELVRAGLTNVEPERMMAGEFPGHQTFDGAKWSQHLRKNDAFLPPRARNIRKDSPTQIIAEFQREDTYLPALALTVCWGVMWRTCPYRNRCLQHIHDVLAQCARSILNTESIEEVVETFDGQFSKQPPVVKRDGIKDTAFSVQGFRI
jgi:hypothetical protein